MSDEHRSTAPMSPARYEAALLEKLTWQFPPPLFRVEGTRNGRIHKVTGVSGEPRQLDAAVYRGEELILVGDAKRHETREVDIGRVDAFVGALLDVRCRFGILVSPRGFTAGAKRRAAAAAVTVLILTYEEALEAELLPTARSIYPHDWAYHRQLARAVLAIQRGQSPPIPELLRDVPFEEWDGFVEYAVSHHTREAVAFLRRVALDHHDGGWRFNAARWLVETGHLDESLRVLLRAREAHDPEFLALLDLAR